jgi:hypothetical protein
MENLNFCIDVFFEYIGVISLGSLGKQPYKGEKRAKQW